LKKLNNQSLYQNIKNKQSQIKQISDSMRKFSKLSILVMGFCLSISFLHAANWRMKTANLMTQYAAKIDTANVLGEYPRPQMTRENWKNLNGIWQFQPSSDASEAIPTGTLSSKILVPFPVESAISGVMEFHDRMWYRRTFTVPAAWAGQRILVHFGAVDYESEVYINKQSLGIHKGGYDSFTYDITPKLTGTGAQEITVRVFDPTDNGGQPRGKQTNTKPTAGIMYTPTSGIWQTVWLEPVPQTSISEIKLVPNVDNSTLKLKAITSGTATGLTITGEVKDGATTVATFTGNANTDLTISVLNPKLWSPDSPFLYDLKITLKSGTEKIDSLKSYFGMRKISMAKVGAYQKMMLNNEFLFQMGPLDQGFWPDGLYTAPTDEAIINDLTKAKQFGFNMIRKHIKVEPQRWYYWADKLGLLIWQDMPSPNSYTGNPQPLDVPEFKSEMEQMIKTHWNSPSIIMWVVFNEGQAQHDTPLLVADVKSLDPSRLVNQASGNNWEGVGHVLDVHSYPQPGCPSGSTQILACGEYGGIGLKVAGHMWATGETYISVNNTTDLMNLYNKYSDMLIQFKTNNGLSAAVYTELTDVETELNGLLTYDRAFIKGSLSRYFDINQGVIHNNIFMTDVLPTSLVTPRNWKYTTTQPTTDWYTNSFDDTNWLTGSAGFGTAGTPGGNISTNWDTNDIWIRQKFNLGTLSSTDLDSLILNVHHDEACEIYLNGVLASTLTGYTSNYGIFTINSEAKNALISNGANTISIHCNQTYGGQYIDAGLSLLSYEKKPVYTDVKNATVQNNCRIYPNPASSKLSIIRKNAQTKLIGVYNLVGSEVMKLNKSAEQVDISKLQSGMYFIKTQTDHEVETISFIKK